MIIDEVVEFNDLSKVAEEIHEPEKAAKIIKRKTKRKELQTLHFIKEWFSKDRHTTKNMKVFICIHFYLSMH